MDSIATTVSLRHRLNHSSRVPKPGENMDHHSSKIPCTQMKAFYYDLTEESRLGLGLKERHSLPDV